MSRPFSPVLASVLLAASITVNAQTTAAPEVTPAKIDLSIEEITIIGDREDAANATGSAQVLDSEELEKFEFANVQQILRAVPGVALQLEDGYGLRPNISIRGTATERSGRITLLEDNVLIAPAPYSAPSAYYFPTAGRMEQMEVLKGSAAIKQGPYTVGGAINMLSTQIPTERTGMVNAEFGSNATTRLHAYYGDSQDNYGWLIETHLWDSEGFQSIDSVGGDTGLDKDDFTAKFRFNSDANSPVYQQLDIKLQYAKENSDQSYLGLTDADFRNNSVRRYAASQLDNIETEHEQIIVRYLASFNDALEFTATVYNNTHERDWFKTERLDQDGSTSAADFDGASWNSIIQNVNLGGAGATELQAILDGADTAPGALQVRSNAREYFSRGIQLGLSFDKAFGNVTHEFEFGLRYHEDEEDRLQRNSTYSQVNSELVLDDIGLLGNAGNRIQSAEALSFHAYDRIEFGNWTLTPGFRIEDIDQSRVRYEIRDGRTTDPSSRSDDNLRSMRDNSTTVFLPGMGVLYSVNEKLSLYGGMHKGFTAPSNSPNVNEEESLNYELGMRFVAEGINIDAALFFTDYDNLLGECTSSSGADCEIGSAFNGDAASIKGLELQASAQLVRNASFSMPLTLSFTHLDGQFDSDIADTAFFGDVSRGDSLPYIPDNQLLLELGFERNAWSAYLRANHVDDVCVRAACGEFERTDAFTVLDLSTHYQVNPRLNLYGRWENITDESAIVGRQPYGARPLIDTTYSLGFRFSL
ncbi:MAG: TonB-dependent receptor family protein [Gammaproteobacteria bacterium]